MSNKNIIIVVTLAIIAFFVYVLTGCKRQSDPSYDPYVLKDSLAKEIEDIHNPTFDNVTGFVNYSKDEAEYSEFISLVSKLHTSTISSIATTVISKHKVCDWKSFLNEYYTEQEVYDNVDKTAKRLYPERADITLSESDTIDLNNVKPNNE